MKRNLALLLAGVMILSSAFMMACGNGNNETPTNDATNDAANEEQVDDTTDEDEEPVNDTDLESISFRFSWWGDDPRHIATQEIIDLYMSENPHITIIPEYAPWAGYQDQFAINLAGGQEADLMQVNYNWLELYSPTGLTFLDLTTVSDYLTLSNWDQEMIDFTTVNGVVQAVPTGITSRTPFMNQTLFESAGLDLEDIVTWDDLMAAGRTMNAELGDGVFALSPLGNPAAGYVVFAYMEQLTGKQFVDEDNNFQYTLEEMTQGFQFFQDLIDNYVVTPGGFDSEPFNSTNPYWLTGEIYGGSPEWDSSITNWLANLSDEIVIQSRPLFTLEDAKLSGVMSRPSMAFAISVNSEHPEEVAKFLEFIVTDERAIEIMGTDRGVPSNKVGLEAFIALDLGGPAVESNNITMNADQTVMPPIWENPSVRALYEGAIADLQLGLITVEEAAAIVYEQVQGEIDAQLGR